MTTSDPQTPRTEYRPEDRSMLGKPPWQPTDPALIEWEKVHGHDVRLDCDVYTPCHVEIAELQRRAEGAATGAKPNLLDALLALMQHHRHHYVANPLQPGPCDKAQYAADRALDFAAQDTRLAASKEERL